MPFRSPPRSDMQPTIRRVAILLLLLVSPLASAASAQLELPERRGTSGEASKPKKPGRQQRGDIAASHSQLRPATRGTSASGGRRVKSGMASGMTSLRYPASIRWPNVRRPTAQAIAGREP